MKQLLSKALLVACFWNALFNLGVVAPEPELFNFDQTSCQESVGICRIPITRSGDTVSMTVLTCSTLDSSAVSPADYSSASYSITFSSGEEENFCGISITNDNIIEDDEAFRLELTRSTDFSQVASTDVLIIDDVAPPDPTPPAPTPPPLSVLQCNETVTISLDNETLAELGVEVGDHVVISPDRLNYADDVADECIQPLSDSVIFEIDVPDCSPTVEEDKYYINFTYVIRNQPAKDRSSPIQRFEDYCLELTCSFDKKTNLTQGSIIPSIRKIQLDSVSVSSEFDLDLNFFTNASYDVILEELTVVVPDDVFVGVELETSSEDEFVVQLHYCYATFTNNINGFPVYDLISDSCAADAAVVVDRNYEAASAEFKFQSFVWTGISDDEQEIFVHCEVTICFDSSDPACTTNECSPVRRRRDLVDDNHRQLVTSQPITILTIRKPSCQQDNGGCSDGCYMEDGEAMCYCFEGRQLESDTKACRELPQVIVVNEEAMKTEETSFPSDQQVLLIAVAALVVGFIVALCITRRKKTTLPIAF